MFTRTFLIATLATAIFPLSLGWAETTIVLVGDSTVSNYGADQPNRGWGQMLSVHANANVKVLNLAASGTSSKSFLGSGRWEQGLQSNPAYVVIQFGHNDRSRDASKGTDPEGEYRANLVRYVTEAKGAGAIPILVTPPVPRAFDEKTGKLGDGRLGPYVAVMKSVGKESGVEVIDLFQQTRDWYATLGSVEAAKFAPKPGDVNHYNPEGAEILAGFVWREMQIKFPELAQCFTPFSQSVP